MSRAPIDPTARIAEQADGILQALGLTSVAVRDDLESVALSLLQDRGHDVEVVGVRYGTLTVRCEPGAAGLLRWDLDDVTAQLHDRFGDTVRKIVVHTGRGNAAG